MHTIPDKEKKNRNRAAATEPSQRPGRGETTFEFVDNRTDAVQLRKLQAMADNSPKVARTGGTKAISNAVVTGDRQADAVRVQTNNETEPVQRKLLDDLNGGTVNVAIVGETHYEIDIDKEKDNWLGKGVKLFHETADIPLAGEEPFTPDDLKLRIVYGYFSARKMAKDAQTHFKSGQFDEVFKNISFIKWAANNMIDDARRAEGTGLSAKLANWLGVFIDIKSKCEGMEHREEPDEMILLMIFTKLNDLSLEMGFLSRDAKEKPRTNDPNDISEARSKVMLDKIINHAPQLSKTIYKVGSDHTNHMKRFKMLGTEVPPEVGIVDRDTYFSEYNEEFPSD